jgi:hypothetical protein
MLVLVSFVARMAARELARSTKISNLSFVAHRGVSKIHYGAVAIPKKVAHCSCCGDTLLRNRRAHCLPPWSLGFMPSATTVV